MSLWIMAWKYLCRRPLVSIMTLLSVALGTALIVAVLTLKRETHQSFEGANNVYDLVVGAKASPLQLVLCSIYHLDRPPGNIPYHRYTELKTDFRVKFAVPLGLGDNYQGFRIVGTDENFFEVKTRKTVDRPPEHVVSLASGARFAAPFESVIGGFVAIQTGLKVGDTFSGTHGLMKLEGSAEHAEFPYTVVGVLALNGTPNDRAIFTPMESVWQVHAAEEKVHEDIGWLAVGGQAPGAPKIKPKDVPEDDRELTSVLVQTKLVLQRFGMKEEINNETEAMAAVPLEEMGRMFKNFIGPMQTSLLAIAFLVVVVAALTILTTLYQSAERRRRDLAIMRALGGRRQEMFTLVLIEALLLTFLGIGLGFVLGHGVVGMASGYLRDEMGLVINPWSFDRLELGCLGAVALVGLVAGFIPALLAYRTSPVRDLSGN
ncbi:MAG: putative ABC transport system permease protein [Kiritimatiellia bacterium]|jgi:putative ABC transport system permease protein